MTPSDWVWYNVACALWYWYRGEELHAKLNMLAALNWANQVKRERLGLRAMPTPGMVVHPPSNHGDN
jgi:hypothetical protein